MYKYSGPEGKVLDSEKPMKVGEVLNRWNLKKGAIAAVVGEDLVDLDREISEDASIAPVDVSSEEGLQIVRHSAAHLMAQAVQILYPGSKFGIGPAIKNGFYYDIEMSEPISEDDLAKIEKEMRRLSKKAIPLKREVLSREDAIARFKERGNQYKVELLSEIEADTVTLYSQGDYVDLCRGPHVPNTSYIKHFKLMSLAGAYWRGDEKNIMLTRIYGTAFADADSLDAHLKKIEEAKRRDHRKLGRELDLFSIQPEGPGFPFFHPKGMVVFNKLVEFWRKVHVRKNYQEIRTPLILNRDLWVRSGHWDHYQDNMYFTEIDDQPYAIKPMNCPGGILVYKSQIRSYRDLPLRLGELGTVHRHEMSGALHGLMRVRCFTQDDAHHYCTPDQIKDEVKLIMGIVDYVYTEVFGFKYHVELSTRPDDAMGDPLLWDKAESALQETLEENGVNYIVNPGDGAFYGPKIDFHLEDCIGRTWQCGTIQLDFQMPEKFDVTYIGADGKEHRPAMLHRTILGSLERFMGILIEQYAGAFPFWIAPIQVRVLPVISACKEYAKKIVAQLRDMDYRVEIDSRDEKLGKKIRDAQVQKVPYMLVIGEKEVAGNTVSVRERSKGDLGVMSVEQLRVLFDEEFDPIK